MSDMDYFISYFRKDADGNNSTGQSVISIHPLLWRAQEDTSKGSNTVIMWWKKIDRDDIIAMNKACQLYKEKEKQPEYDNH